MLKIYIENLHTNKGGWTGLPSQKLDTMLEVLNPNGNHDMIISDFETDIQGLKVGEYDDIETLNDITEQIDDLSDDELVALQAYLINGSSLDEALEKATDGDYTIYYNCDNMEDVAYQVVNESGLLDGVPETIKGYFDYEAYGRDIDIEGTFIQVDNNIIELY